jgi:hypothetical protein
MEENCREYELTKHFSLKLHFPVSFLQLKTDGCCEIDIPEWMFDLDYPGQYMRRIRNISLSVPCVAGPYTGVHCKAQLLKSKIRTVPLLPGPEACCCHNELKQHCEHDPYLVTRYDSQEAIAISTGLDDDGLFELNFRDERYLPFEFSGAISKWRIELPQENNQFDFDSLSDFIIHLNYTAREGGPALRLRAAEAAQERVLGAGMRYFDIRHEFPDSWPAFDPKADRHPHNQNGEGIRKHHRDFDLWLNRNMFPFLTGRRRVAVHKVHLFIDKSRDAEPCGDHIGAVFMPARPDGNCDTDESCNFVCRADRNDCGTLHHGSFDVKPRPISSRQGVHVGKVRLLPDLVGVTAAYLVCEYRSDDGCATKSG